MMTEIKESILFVDDIADLLQVSRKTIHRMLNDGRLKGKRTARKWIVTKDNFKKYLEGDVTPVGEIIPPDNLTDENNNGVGA